MLWFLLILATVLIAAGASLAASWSSRRDLVSGRPSFDSVADLTGIWNRSKLDEFIGPRDDEDRYTVNAETVRKIPRTWWKRWFDREIADVGCIALSLVAFILIGSHSSFAWGLLTISAAYISIGYLGGVLVVLRNRP